MQFLKRGTFLLQTRTRIEDNVVRAGRCYYFRNRLPKDSLYSRISPLGDPNVNVSPELEKWVDSGKRVSFAEARRIIIDLRKRRRYSHALQVSEWIMKKGIYKPTPIEHAVQLDLLGKVHGFSSAENYFNTLSEEDKTLKTYGALLHCYVRARKIDLSLSHLQKMKENGICLTVVNYNDIMSLYANMGQNEKVPDVLNEMTENGVSPDNLSYKLCISSYGARSDIEGMERTLEEMERQPHIAMDWSTYTVVAKYYMEEGLTEKAMNALKKAEGRLDKKDALGYNHLISLHASLGNKDEVLRIWDLEKQACRRCINRDYKNILESLVKLGELEEAEKILNEWESAGNCYDLRLPLTVTDAYADKGLCEKAETMLQDMMDKGKMPTANSWEEVATGYLGKVELDKAVKCMKLAFSTKLDGKNWTPKPDTMTRIFNLLGEKGGAKDVKEFMDVARTAMPVNKQMYHALLKSYVRSGEEVSGVLSSMRADNVDEDEETRKILSME